jgi:hypothetical protein
MTISPGDFWNADIPFTDGSATKKRPVLMLWLDGRDVVVDAVASSTPDTYRYCLARLASKWLKGSLNCAIIASRLP